MGPMKTYAELRTESAFARPTILVDLDGTLAIKGDRDPFDWSRVGEDLPNEPVVFVVKHLQLFTTIVVVSGRDEICRWQSEMWLYARGIFFHQLFMRPHKDNRPDHVVKKEIYEQAIKLGYKNVLAAIDDRKQVLDMWRELGLFTFDVGNGKGDF